MIRNGTTIEHLVRDHRFLSTMCLDHLAVICQGAKITEFKPGEIIFRTGEPANYFFLIQSGKVALETRTSDGQDIQVEVLGEGDAVGWSWLVPPFSWHLQARAIEPTEMIALDGAHLLVACEEDHDFGHTMMKRVAQVMAHRFETIRQRFVEKCECHSTERPVQALAVK